MNAYVVTWYRPLGLFRGTRHCTIAFVPTQAEAIAHVRRKTSNARIEEVRHIDATDGMVITLTL